MMAARGLRRRSPVVAALALVLACTASACGWQGINSIALPGTHGRGDGAWEVRIRMPDVVTLQRNSQVLVDDVEVGRVADLKVQGSHALVTVSLDAHTRVPANATATIGQTTLLGSAHIELGVPSGQAAHGSLRAGDTIDLAHAGAYPTTEQTLATVSMVLGGGGIDQIQDITREVNAAIGGRESAARSVIGRLDTLLGDLDGQRAQITRAIEGLDDLTTRVAAQRETLADAIESLRPALSVLATRRVDLTRALDSLGALSRTATSIVTASGSALRADLAALPPILGSLADSGKSLTESTRYLLTYPFPIDTYANAVRGDYANGEVTLDLRLTTLDNALLLGTPLQGMLSGVEGIVGRAAPASSSRPAPGLTDLLTPRPAIGPSPGGTP
ncbi:MCE family protein [Williamsia herbipolensis]|uniref:MCE family protein n=1 Tax=Williamsia herbipolensis TaxID=1603258 RepID=A0AAU4K5A0_9NOCA|nr:MCE family protein [Williamsia herbipolensis]